MPSIIALTAASQDIASGPRHRYINYAAITRDDVAGNAARGRLR